MGEGSCQGVVRDGWVVLSVPSFFVVMNFKRLLSRVSGACTEQVGVWLGIHAIESLPKKSPHFLRGSKGAVKRAIPMKEGPDGEQEVEKKPYLAVSKKSSFVPVTSRAGGS